MEILIKPIVKMADGTEKDFSNQLKKYFYENPTIRELSSQNMICVEVTRISTDHFDKMNQALNIDPNHVVMEGRFDKVITKNNQLFFRFEMEESTKYNALLEKFNIDYDSIRFAWIVYDRSHDEIQAVHIFTGIIPKEIDEKIIEE